MEGVSCGDMGGDAKIFYGWFAPLRLVGGVAAAGTALASSLNIINTATNKQHRQQTTDSSHISSSNKSSHSVISLTRAGW